MSIANLRAIINRGVAARRGPPADPVVAMLAHALYGPGHSTGAAPLTGDGTQKTYRLTTVNRSQAIITRASIATQGWTLRSTGTTDAGNDNMTEGVIEYPVGTVVGTFASWNTPNGGIGLAVDQDLITPIPKGASFAVELRSTPAAGQKYIANLGFSGVRNHAKKSELSKVGIYAVGDSIMTNNNGAAYNAASSRCPVYHASISGTRANAYGANNAEFFKRQTDLAKALGITDIVCDFGTNDFGSSATLADLKAWLLAMKAAANAVGVKFVQTTMLPRTLKKAPVAASAVTSSGTTMTMTVPDTSFFTVNKPYVIAGATQTEYNGSKICIGKDEAAGTISFLFSGSATTPATGTITVGIWKDTFQAEWMLPFGPQYVPGAASDRALFNAWVRGGAFDGFIEWADAVESSRDSGRWAVAGEKPELPEIQLVNVTSVISTSRFNSNYARGSSTLANGFVQALTGPNAGFQRQGSNNTNGDITVTAAWPQTQVVGNQYYVVPGVSYISDDGTHPRVSTGGKGGQVLLDNATAAWLDQRIAA